jgi:hypothetical protein
VIVVILPALVHAQPSPQPAPSDPAPKPVPPPVPDPLAPTTPAAPPAAPAPTDVYVVSTPRANDPSWGLDVTPPYMSVPFPRERSQRLIVDLELFTSGDWTLRDGSDLAQFRLDRGELGTTFRYNSHAGAELRLETLRSAAEGGALGIAGDSLVVRPKRAQVFADFDASKVAVHVALGVTPDPWLAVLEEDYPLRPLSPTASERFLGWPTSDLAALVRVDSGPVRLSISVGNGEGLSYPERNNGKTTTAVAEVVPFHLVLQRLRFMVMGKNGSVGPGLVRDHRVGGGATFYNDFLSIGSELVRAWGVGDRGDVAAWVIGGWADVHTGGPFRLAVRAATIGYDAGGRHSTIGGALAIVPFDDDPPVKYDSRSPLRVWLAVDRSTASGNAAPLPGSDPGNATTLMLIASTSLSYGAD